jgi:Glycosyl transferase family 2
MRKPRDLFTGRLLVIHHPMSLGMEAASNAGLKAATGRYFAIHDDDDRWDAAFLTRRVEFLEAPEKASYIGVATGCDVVQERIEDGCIETGAQFPWIYFTPPISYSAMIERNQIPPITLLLRRVLLSRIGGYNEALPMLGDWEFILRALAVGDVGALEDRLAFYHHRLKADMPVYANSVTDGLNIHSEMRARPGNNIIRASLREQPSLLGVLWPMLQALQAEIASHAELMRRLDAQDAELQVIRQATEPQRKIFALLRRLLRKRPRDTGPLPQLPLAAIHKPNSFFTAWVIIEIWSSSRHSPISAREPRASASTPVSRK